jgi:hypothetical protein
VTRLEPVPREPRPPALGYHAVVEYLPDGFLEHDAPPFGIRLHVLDTAGGRCTWDVHVHHAEPLVHHLRRDPRVRQVRAHPFEWPDPTG